MGGNLLYLCGMVDKRTMEKYEKEAKEAGRESWYLSWALDSTTQERAKGKTVEVGRAYFETEKRRYTILDAPGDKTYVPSMISGAAQVTLYRRLVLSTRADCIEGGHRAARHLCAQGRVRDRLRKGRTDARTYHACQDCRRVQSRRRDQQDGRLYRRVAKGASTRPLHILDRIDLTRLQSRYDEIVGKLQPFLKGSSFNLKTDVMFLPVSAYTGANLKEKVSKATCPWWEYVHFFFSHLNKRLSRIRIVVRPSSSSSTRSP